MDMMELRRAIMFGGADVANAWKYTKTVYTVAEYHNYDTYRDFASVYINPLINGLTDYILLVKLNNNTTNTRAAQWHMEYVNGSNKIAHTGKRSGGNFDEAYGGDVYAGCEIEVYVSTEIPILE